MGEVEVSGVLEGLSAVCLSEVGPARLVELAAQVRAVLPWARTLDQEDRLLELLGRLYAARTDTATRRAA